MTSELRQVRPGWSIDERKFYLFDEVEDDNIVVVTFMGDARPLTLAKKVTLLRSLADMLDMLVPKDPA